jgi:NAD(P)-dependent dehydrogenase (short-subunit alcohol dehydrogenase family)
MQRRLEHHVAWISGGTSGIGAATARLFAREGAKVVVVGRRQTVAQDIVERIRQEGGSALAVCCDVTREEEVRRSIASTIETFGSLQILINNAGTVEVKLLHEYTPAAFERVVAVNVMSMYHAFRSAYPHLKQNRRSYVVNVGSISSFVGQCATPVYTTTKHAILGLTRSIALDYAADGIRCNCVCPGITDTPMLREHLSATGDPEGALRKRLKRVPMGIALTPDDVAKAIRYFSCEDSSGVTGASLVIDAGYLAAAEWEHPGHTAFMDPP